MRKVINNSIAKLAKQKKIMLIIFVAVVIVIGISIASIYVNKNKIDNRFYGYYASDSIVVEILPNGICSVSAIIDKSISDNSTCSWTYNGLFDEDFNLNENGIFASSLIIINQDNKTMELNATFTEDYSSFLDTTNDRMTQYKKIQKYEKVDTKKLKHINGSATAYFEKEIEDHAYMEMFHTFHFYDDMTCEIENSKQVDSTNNSNWPPSDPNTKWRFLYEINFGECHYEISNSPYYQLTVYTSEINESGESKLIFPFFIKFGKNSEVVSLNLMLQDDTEREYLFIHRDGKNFGADEKEQRVLKREKEEKIKKQYIGTWSNTYTELVIKEDGTCYINDATSCIWVPIASNGYVKITYSTKYDDTNEKYYSINDNLSQINLVNGPTVLNRN
ncbi:MAG: hypothetical protein ACM3O4_04440 [Ignavibacteriales bacterium]